MDLLLFSFIDNVSVWYFFTYHLSPPAVWFVFFFWWMSTAASKTVMFHFYSLFSLFKCLSYFLTTENISIEMLTKDLCCFILNSIFWVYHDNVFHTHLEKNLSYILWMTWIDKNNIRKKFFYTFEYFHDLICVYHLQSAYYCSWIILKL